MIIYNSENNSSNDNNKKEQINLVGLSDTVINRTDAGQAHSNNRDWKDLWTKRSRVDHEGALYRCCVSSLYCYV